QPDAVEVQHGYVFDESSRTSWSSNEGRNKYDSATGTYVLQVSEQYPYKRVLRFRVSNYEDVVVDFPDDADGPQMIDVVFKPLEMFGTRVVDADTGVALSNVVVAFVSPNDQMRLDHYVNFGDISRGVTQFTGRKSMTNEDGKFKLPRSGVNDETVLVAIRPDNGFVCVRNVAGLVASKDWELPFPASANIEGVITAGGKPCAGERIRVEWIAPTSQNSRHDFPFGFGGQLQADNQGRFTAKGVGPGRYSIMRVRHFNFPDGTGMSTYISPRQEIVVPPGKTVKCDVSRPAGLSLTAQAVDPNNQPLPNVIITIYGSEDYSDVVEMVLTDSEGRFAAEHLPEATLTMRIRPMGINRAQPAFDGESQFSLKEDTTDAVIRFRPGEMRLRGPGFARLADAALPNNEQQADGQADDDKDKVHVRGQITDRSAVALPLSLTVVCLSETGETFSATSQNDGTFQLKLLPGRYVARINDAPGFYQFSATTFEVKQAGPQDLFTIAVAPAISLFGSVTTSTGEPAIGAVVYVDGMREPARTNEQGQFVLPDVPPRPDLVVRAGDATGTLVGVLPLANVEQIGPLQLSIGKSFTSDGKFGPGCEVPDIRLASIKSLDPDRKNADEQLKPWRFNEVDNTLVVFAELWNPAGRKFALDAAQWAHDHVADLVVISSDWSVRIAARYATELGDNPPPVHWGGPGGAEADRWRFAGGNQCYLVSPRRVFLSCPPQGEMP
ncbi:MAG: hypothetical protein KDA99_26190, partial [Planctomycetales bacterium]|nr:hypothetical protein [Planctomycetales bacterium]